MLNPFMTEVPVANQWTGFYMMGTSVMKELRGVLTNANLGQSALIYLVLRAVA